MKYLSFADVECIMCFKVFNSTQDKKDFVEYLYHYKLISERTRNKFLESLGE